MKGFANYRLFSCLISSGYVHRDEHASMVTVGRYKRIILRSTRSIALHRMSLPSRERTRPLSCRVSFRFEGHSFTRIRSITLQRSTGASFCWRRSDRMSSSNRSCAHDAGLGGCRRGRVRVSGASGDTRKLINIYLNYVSNFQNRGVVKADEKFCS